MLNMRNNDHLDSIHIELQDIPDHHPAKLFYDYWERIKGDKDLPLRHDLIPPEIPSILPYIILLEAKFHNGRQDYFDRLEGEGIIEICGASDSKKFISEIMPKDKFEKRHKEFVMIGETKTPLFEMGHISYLDKAYIKVVRGAFPFSKEGDTADYFILILARADAQIMGR
tara:strand:+ start:3350 stop:3859 length:510 start_codon:yes stop_codon:yes gene_type:complete